jgi:alanyl-tRNA synthetase
MRNHTATHLLHHALHAVLGEHARQAGSRVAPDRLRFDFTHPEAMTDEQVEQVETIVNTEILGNYQLNIAFKPLQQAIADGAIALFGEKYGETVRNITIGEPEIFSNELCGGTHVEDTGDIGVFLITSEGSAAAGVRRIEAVTGRQAYQLIQRRFRTLKRAADELGTNLDDVPGKVRDLEDELAAIRKQAAALRRELAGRDFERLLEQPPLVAGIPVLTAELHDADADTLRTMADRFRQKHASGVVVLAAVQEGRPMLVAAVTDDLVKRGLHAGELVKHAAAPLGGGGGGRPNLAQAGGKDPSRLPEALASVAPWVQSKL